MKVRLNKITSVHNNLSRDWYTGFCSELPIVGKSFLMDSKEEGMLWTTKVLSYNTNFPSKTIRFKTKNSEYELVLEAE